MAEAGPLAEFDAWFKMAASCGLQVGTLQQLLQAGAAGPGSSALGAKRTTGWLMPLCLPHKTPPPQEPNAMSLATASADGRPSVRYVLLKGYDERGFVFYTNRDSSKVRLVRWPQGGACIHDAMDCRGHAASR